jgi:hypothetical protein
MTLLTQGASREEDVSFLIGRAGGAWGLPTHATVHERKYRMPLSLQSLPNGRVLTLPEKESRYEVLFS